MRAIGREERPAAFVVCGENNRRRPRRRRRDSHQAHLHKNKILFITLLLILEGTFTHGYHRAPCKKLSVRSQFQFTDCFVPNLNPDLYINEASFVMAHDAATGYLNVNNNDDDDNGGGTGNEYINEYNGVDNMNNLDYSGRNMENDGEGGNYNNNGAYYFPSRWNTITTRLLSLYGKTQVGSVYEQLNDGARALDLRPKIYNNGTVGFHHGSLIDIPLTSITLGGLLEDAKQWCNDNPKELVLIFHSELVHEAGYNGLSSQVYVESDDNYNDDANDDANGDDGSNRNLEDEENEEEDAAENNEEQQADNDDDGYQQQEQQYQYYYSGVAKMKQIYKEAGVPYISCDEIAGLTVGDIMEMADLSKLDGKGYLIAVDRHDMYASFCGKANWVQDELVTCHTKYYEEQQQQQHNQDGDNSPQMSFIHCTDTKGTGLSKLNALKEYVTASTNNDASDNYNELGPPADESYYPFNQIQGFWQVDATSVQIGLMHASNLLDDNRRSDVNKEMATMAYHGEFNAISVFALDNVALNGNAMFSILRNACGQSVIPDDMENPACGQELVMPNMSTSHTLPLVWNIVLFVVYGALAVMVLIMLVQAFGLRNEGPQEHRLICHGHVV